MKDYHVEKFHLSLDILQGKTAEAEGHTIDIFLSIPCYPGK